MALLEGRRESSRKVAILASKNKAETGMAYKIRSCGFSEGGQSEAEVLASYTCFNRDRLRTGGIGRRFSFLKEVQIKSDQNREPGFFGAFVYLGSEKLTGEY
jgi:hypothetical protein